MSHLPPLLFLKRDIQFTVYQQSRSDRPKKYYRLFPSLIYIEEFRLEILGINLRRLNLDYCHTYAHILTLTHWHTHALTQNSPLNTTLTHIYSCTSIHTRHITAYNTHSLKHTHTYSLSASHTNRQPTISLTHIHKHTQQADEHTHTHTPVIFPHGLDALLEEGVVAARGQPGGELYVVVQGPEVLHRVEGDDLPLVLLPRFGLVVFEKPQRPWVLKGPHKKC